MLNPEKKIEPQLVVGEKYYVCYGIHRGTYVFKGVEGDGLFVFSGNTDFGFYAEVEPYLFSRICREISDLN